MRKIVENWFVKQWKFLKYLWKISKHFALNSLLRLEISVWYGRQPLPIRWLAFGDTFQWPCCRLVAPRCGIASGWTHRREREKLNASMRQSFSSYERLCLCAADRYSIRLCVNTHAHLNAVSATQHSATHEENAMWLCANVLCESVPVLCKHKRIERRSAAHKHKRSYDENDYHMLA